MNAAESVVNLPRQFIAACRAAGSRKKLADSTGMEMTGSELLLRTLVLRRLLRRELAADERMVGLLLPPSAAGVLANAAVTLDRRVAVNLNYTLSSEVLNDCAAQAGLKHVITSRRVIERLRERFSIELSVDAIYLEDLKDRVRLADKLLSAAEAYLLPQSLLAVEAAPDSARRPADGDLHFGSDGAAQGRDAQPSKCRLEYRRH